MSKIVAIVTGIDITMVLIAFHWPDLAQSGR